MKINPVELIHVDRLYHNSENPKSPLGKKYKDGLQAGLARWGFSGVLVVAADDDGRYEILDGNTRLEELRRNDVKEVPCVVHRGMSADERKKFVLAHDRNRKKFNEDVVLAQLEGLVAKGENAKNLALLSGKDNLERLLAEKQNKATASQSQTTGGGGPVAMVSMVLYGPVAEIAKIKGLIGTVKGRLSTLEKARKDLDDAGKFFDWEAEESLVCLLATVAAVAKGKV